MRSLTARYAGLICACIIATTIALLHTAYAAISRADDPNTRDTGQDTAHKGMAILFIGTINADCYPDTVWGDRGGAIDESMYIPRVIIWGRQDRSGLRGRKDTTSLCRGSIPDRFKVPYTLITYPPWKNLRASLTTFRFNPEDTLTDLFISIRGTVDNAERRRDTPPGDSLRLLLVFGQDGLDTLKTIDLGDIDVVQTTPFVAMELRKGSEVVGEKNRDLSGRKSYELNPVGFHQRKADTNAMPHPSPAPNVLHVYPNPTGIAAQIEGNAIAAGEYSVEIVAVNGEVVHEQNVTVKESGNLLGTLDVTDLPTGYYMVRLQQHGKLLGTYPIVVTH